ncbi:NDR1/HIN1-like protein 13 [Aristolochia californica]|uniref:NDR1/HIN1-like protein 13 n=1 Tax=Aristolochia californica TaxID=171875 RepID=UPI0035DA28FD
MHSDHEAQNVQPEPQQQLRRQQQPLPQQQRQQHLHQLRHPLPRKHALHAPVPRRTNKLTWFAAIFCALFWVLVIVGGLVVLIVYLVFRPRYPHFDISTATFNMAYLDTGTLLNADVTILVNFTNLNKKVGISFSYVVIDLYFGKTLVASRSVDPFSQASQTQNLANVHMVSSQVLLPLNEANQLKRLMESNSLVPFDVKGTFRTRSNYGSVFHYSYWLHGDCNIKLRIPPSGVLVSRQCKTKR